MNRSVPEGQSHAPTARRLKLLVAWYGAFDGHGTIGDLLSAEALSSHLRACGHEVDCASFEPYPELGEKIVGWHSVSASDYDAFLFTCGPILKTHPQLSALFEKFKGKFKVGVGVSLFPQEHLNYANPFDVVYAREGATSIYEDIAILAPNRLDLPPQNLARTGVTVGVVLRGAQGEYGASKCLSQLADATIEAAAKAVLEARGGSFIAIENHLRQSGISPLEIEEQYRKCDVVLTTRFHGAILAMRHGLPFIAIDQILGGAKLTNLLQRNGWPHIFNIEAVTINQIVASAFEALDGRFSDLDNRLRALTRVRAERTLVEVAKLLTQV